VPGAFGRIERLCGVCWARPHCPRRICGALLALALAKLQHRGKSAWIGLKNEPSRAFREMLKAQFSHKGPVVATLPAAWFGGGEFAGDSS